MAPPANRPISPHKDWVKSQFYLNHEGLQQVLRCYISVLYIHTPVCAHMCENFFEVYCFCFCQVNWLERESPSRKSLDNDKKIIKVNVADIISVAPCSDLTLPPGAGLCIDTIHGPIFLVRPSSVFSCVKMT